MNKGLGLGYQLFIILLLLHLTSYSQINIKGKVIDKNGPVEFASILLKNDKNILVIHQTTDSLGSFLMNVKEEGRFLIFISMTGYVGYKQELVLKSGNSIILDTVHLELDVKSMGVIQISGAKKLINKTSQGLIFNAAENITLASGTATDLLRNTPTVVVDAEGGISIRSKSPMILINGRNSGIGSLDRIPASSVESVEIINNPNASYDAESEAGIINIKLKKNNAVGSNGSLGMGSGYGSRARVNSTFIYNYRNNKWNIGLSYDNRFAGRTRSANSQRTNFDLPYLYYLIQKRNDNRIEKTHNAKVNIDFTPNKRNELGIEVLGNKEAEDNHETLLSTVLSQQKIAYSDNSRHSDEIIREKAIEFAFNYKRNFEDKRKRLSLNMNSAMNKENENTDITTYEIINGDIARIPFFQKTSNLQPSKIQNLKFDFAYPINKNFVFEVGYKGTSRLIDAMYTNSYKYNDIYLINTKASNKFHFNESISAVYFKLANEKFDKKETKFHFDAGLRIETTVNKGKLETESVDVKNQYLKFFPNVNLNYDLSNDQSIRLSIGRRINRPGLGQLNPFIDITDSLNPHGGNPYLKPELINVSELSHLINWNNISLSSVVYYRNAFNSIRSFINVDSNGIGLSLPKNIGNTKTYGIEEMMSVKYGKYWNMNLSVSAYQQIIDATNVDQFAKNSLVSWYGKIIQNFNFFQGNIIQVIANYNSPIATPQGKRLEVYNVDLGIRQKILKGKGAIGIAATDIFNTQIGRIKAYTSNFEYYRYFKIDTRAILCTFTYSFKTKLREELMENKFLNE